MAAIDVTNKQPIRPLTDLSNAEMLNLIRNESSPAYQSRIPAATQASVERTMRNIMSYTATKNEFYSTLVNRIMQTYVNTWKWSNPLGVFTRATEMYGDTFEEVAVGMPKAQIYDPNAEYLGADNFRKWKVPVDTLFHTLDFQHFYPVTTEDKTLRRAFLSDNGLGSLTAQLITSCYNALAVDLFETQCNLFAQYARMGGYWRVHCDTDLNDPAADNSEAAARTLLKNIRTYAESLKFVSTKWNARHMPTFATPDNLVLFVTPEVKACIDVDALAAAFNMDRMNVPFDRIITIPKESFGMDGVQAILTTNNFFIDIPVIEEMTQQINPVNINSVNNYLHAWRILSVSAFQPAVLFWTGEGSTEAVTLPEGVTAAKPSFALRIHTDGTSETPTNVARGGAVQVEATTTTTNDETATWTTSAVSYALGKTEVPVSQWTRISSTGVLTVGADEPNATLPVTATATYIDPAHPEVPDTVSAQLDVPVVGDAVTPAMPVGIVKSLTIKAPVDLKKLKANFNPVQLTVLADVGGGMTIDVTRDVAYTLGGSPGFTVSSNGVFGYDIPSSTGSGGIIANGFGMKASTDFAVS